MFKWVSKVVSAVKGFVSNLVTKVTTGKWKEDIGLEKATTKHIKEVTKRKQKAQRKQKLQNRLDRAKDLIMKATGKLDDNLSAKLNNLFNTIEETETPKKASEAFWNIYLSIKNSEFNYYTKLLSSQDYELDDVEDAAESFYESAYEAYEEFRKGR